VRGSRRKALEPTEPASYRRRASVLLARLVHGVERHRFDPSGAPGDVRA
jgi:hypothetical protein